MEYNQLKTMIKRVLHSVEMPSDALSVKLLSEIACVESDCGNYLEQINGPAKGIFQIEPNTARDIIRNYLAYNYVQKDRVMGLYLEQLSLADNLAYNLPFSIAMCRAFFLRFNEKIPSKLEERAKYWKKYYNTEKGKGTVKKYLEKVREYVR